jgi:hypothetical protein
MEFTFHKDNSGRLAAHNIASTPQSIISRFKAERFTTDMPETPTVPRKVDIEPCFQGTMDSPMSMSDSEPHHDMETTNDLQSELPHHNTMGSPMSMNNDHPYERELSNKRIFAEIETSPTTRITKRRKLIPIYFGLKELRAADVMFPTDIDTVEGDILITNPSHPTGERLYVQRLMRKLMYCPDITEFPHNDSLRTVWKTHPATLVKKHEQHAAFVFDTTATGECRVFKAPVDSLGIPEEFTHRPRNPADGMVRFAWDDAQAPFEAGDDWEYLNKWIHMAGDTLLPKFLDSDSEDGEYDESILREMDAEERQRNGIEDISKPLSVDVVRETITLELDKYAETWNLKDLPKLQLKAYLIYRKYQKNGTRNFTALKFRKHLERITARIDGYKIEYECMEWRSVTELRRVCGNMQESVNRQKELEWSIELLSGRAPAKPVVEEQEEDHVVDDSQPIDDSLIDDEAVQTGDDDSDGEGDEDDEDEDEDDGDDGDEMEDDGMDGFIIGDDEVGDIQFPDDYPMMGDEVSLVNEAEEEEEEEEEEIPMSQNTAKRSRRCLKIIDDEDDEEEKVGTGPDEEREHSTMPEDGMSVVSENVDPETLDPDPLELAPMDPEPFHSGAELEPVDTELSDCKPIRIRPTRRSTANLASSLPIPSEEVKEEPQLATKQERNPGTPPNTPDIPDISGYDPDIPWFFGDEESASFCQCTEASAKIAKIYLLRADGDISGAVGSFFEDKEMHRVLEPKESPDKPKPVARSRGKRTVIELSDDDEPLAELSEIFRASNVLFSKVILRDDTIEDVRALVAGVPLADLHQTIMEVAERVHDQDLDPTSQFITCETLENCAAYWKIYLAYTQHLFGRATKRLSTNNLESINNTGNFKIFHNKLILYLDVDAPQPTPSKRKSQREGSAESEIDSSPLKPTEGKEKKRSKSDKLKKKKFKMVKPIIKSAEQISQEAELQRIADRERDQKRKGINMSIAHDGSIVVNPAKNDTDAEVCLHPELAKKMKEHQIEGLRFIWKQVSL